MEIKVLEALEKHNNVLQTIVSRIDRDFLDECLRWSDGDSPRNIGAKLRFNRLVRKFHVPDPEVQDRLQQECWDLFLQTDSRNARFTPAYFDERLCAAWRSSEDRFNIYIARMRLLLSKWLDGFNPAWNLSQPGPGDNFVSLAGFNSEYSKYVNGHWGATKKALRYLRVICKSTQALRKYLISVGWQRCKKIGIEWSTITQAGKGSNLLFSIGFREKVYGPWEQRGDLQKNYADRGFPRFSSVPKDNTKRRPICLSSLGQQLVESAVAAGLESCLDKIGNHLGISNVTGVDGQARHRKRLLQSGWSTIDLKSASDSNIRSLVWLIFPKHVLKYIDAACPSCIVGPRGELVKLCMVSPMGNRVTFPLMTLILLAACHAVRNSDADGDHHSQSLPLVYGDDIMIEDEFAPELMTLLNEIGYQVNEAKSFVKSPVVESCGGYVAFGQPLVSFDVVYADTPAVMIANTNKMYLNWKNAIDPLEKAFWRQAYNELLVCVEAYVGPCPIDVMDHLGSWVYSDLSIEQPIGESGLVAWLATQYQEVTHFVVNSPFFKNEERDPPVRQAELRLFRRLRIKTGRCPKDHRRDYGEWSDKKALIMGGRWFGTFEGLRRLRSEQYGLYSNAQLGFYEAWLAQYSIHSDRY